MIDATLVTVHGFGSSPATWDRLAEVWRADEELHGLRIHPFGYPSPKKPRLPFSVTRVPDYDDIAQMLSTEYATVLADASAIAVVTHSQGGLILQRFLAWMIGQGRARELSRIRSVVMLACPNGGSEYLESLRRTLGYARHPQAGSLHVLDRQVADTQRTVLERIVNAAVSDDYHCRIPFHVYAGGSDHVVRTASAQAAFPGASTIAGSHFTILDPAAPGNRTAETVKRHMLADWATGKDLPRDLVQVNAVARVLTGPIAPALQAREQLVTVDTERGSARPAPGLPITELDPFALEVHRLVEAESAKVLPALPPYARRAHDEALAAVVAAAAGGQSQLAVLVGGSSTGKTRACWEAVTAPGALPDGWRLWHPYDPTGPEALLEGLPAVAPRTVIWLNEAQLYLLEAPAGAAERAAATLRTLLADSGRGPVLVLATLWPDYWDALTRETGTRRTLLEGRRITVPGAFTQAQVAAMRRSGDPRLAAAGAAGNGQVTQFLAGAPVLLDRYQDALPSAQAVIESAMDARRLGHGIALPHAFLKAAAPAYMSDADWDSADDDWLEQAVAFTAEPCKGTAGPLTSIRPRPASGQAAESTPPAPGGLAYKLADYLDQHGRRHRAAQFPPDEFWSAAAGCGSPDSQAALGAAARGRGLFRHAAQLRKNATCHGDPYAAAALIADMHHLDPSDQRAASLALAHVSLDDPNGVFVLLKRLQAIGASGQVTELAARAAAGVALDSPDGVAILLGTLQEAGATGRVAELAARAAVGAALDDPFGVGILLDTLQALGAAEHVAELLARNPAAAAVLDNPNGVVSLLDRLRAVGAVGQAAELATRAAAGAAHDNPLDLARLLAGLQAAGAAEQVNKLLARNPAATVTLADLFGLARLLDSLREAGAAGQVAELAARAAAGAALDDPYGVASLLAGLQAAGAAEQVTELLARNHAATVALDSPDGVAILLGALLEADAEDQVTELLARDPAATVALDQLSGVARLLDRLREAGAAGQVAELTARAAACAVLEDPLGVASLLDRMREAGSAEQVTELLARNPAATVALDNQYSVARLLDRLRAIGAAGQVTELTTRLPAAGLFELHPDYGSRPYRFGREPNGRPALAWGWHDLD